ncbi:conserved hypothetical protein [Trichinella spiralis]|uniref:hypothetical protein n=1 Tax=Trichinella spiralis TaxID=6334 RepID=UPI0001EFC441|nr:conserved hypothetical protein [Trichinella spiralis]
MHTDRPGGGLFAENGILEGEGEGEGFLTGRQPNVQTDTSHYDVFACFDHSVGKSSATPPKHSRPRLKLRTGAPALMAKRRRGVGQVAGETHGQWACPTRRRMGKEKTRKKNTFIIIFLHIVLWD